MRYTFDHDYHIHSQISSCSRDPLQTPEAILEYAKKYGLRSVCLTDHFWDETVPGASKWYEQQNFDWISRAKPLPKDSEIRFLFGCETDLDKFMTLGISPERFSGFDFVVIPTTHLHMKGFTLSDEDAQSLERRAELWVSRLEGLLEMPLPFGRVGIAHPICELMAPSSREDFLRVLEMISSEDMERIFTKAASVGVGIELNSSDMSFEDDEADIVLRPYRIARECGCKFYCGSDAHHPAGLHAAKDIFERAIDFLKLEESDKFRIEGM